MKTTTQDRAQILTFFLGLIQSIADKAYQKRVWIRGEGPECEDYDEVIDYFFHEGEEIMENYQDYKITDAQHLLLKELWEKLDPFTEQHHLPEDFIDTSEWESITAQAKKILKSFNYVPTNAT